jgi:hypothetical protein
MQIRRHGAALAIVGVLGTALAAPGTAFADASEGASCAGQFATSVPGGPLKGEFASGNAKEDGRMFGSITSTFFARGDRDACPF